MKDFGKIGFLGFGAMASAMAGGLRRAGCQEKLFACAAHYDGLKERAAALGVSPCRTPEELVQSSDLIIAAVKPYQMEAVLAPLREALEGKPLLSVASGWDFDRLSSLLGEGCHCLCCMPNTPVAVGEGVLLLEERCSLTEEELAGVRALLSRLGLVLTLPGPLKETGGILSGCGPAWAAMFLEALGDAGVKHGLPRAAAYELAGQMLAGTARLQLETGKHPGTLKDEVCSPGGTTIAGVSALEERGFRGTVISAVDAVIEKKKN